MQTNLLLNLERHWPFAHEVKKKIEKLKHEIEFMQRKCPKRFGWQMNEDIKMIYRFIHPCQVLKIYLGSILKI
jgi:tetrahydromethanopterin S-methyltransferase subunit G